MLRGETSVLQAAREVGWTTKSCDVGDEVAGRSNLRQISGDLMLPKPNNFIGPVRFGTKLEHTRMQLLEQQQGYNATQNQQTPIK